MKTSLPDLWLLGVVLAAGWPGTLAGCSVSMTDGLPDPAPLILVREGTPDALGFKLPSPSGHLNFTSGEKVRLACPGPGNSFRNLGSNLQDASVTCERDVTFRNGRDGRKFSSLGCSKVPQAATRRNGERCHGNKHPVLQIGFEVGAEGEFVKVIEVCFDEQRLTALWSKSHVLSVVKLAENVLRPLGSQFTSSNFFPGLNLDTLYSKRTQRTNIGRIIGKTPAAYYINTTHFLARGLLSNSANFIYESQKVAALNFVNVVPQWSKFKAGLWDVVERRIRGYADGTGEDLVVYTGTHGVTTLSDMSEENTEREMYLSVRGSPPSIKQVPVPAVLWKVVYEPVSKRAVVLVSVNNPHKNKTAVESDPQRYKVCETKRYLSRWYVCASSNQEVGLGYCCEVNDFRNFVKSLPAFEVTDLLS